MPQDSESLDQSIEAVSDVVVQDLRKEKDRNETELAPLRTTSLPHEHELETALSRLLTTARIDSASDKDNITTKRSYSEGSALLAPAMLVPVHDSVLHPYTSSKCCPKPPRARTVIIPKGEAEYTEKFKKSFAAKNGVSLKKDFSQRIKKIEGVESVGVGFSTKRDGYWPVIRVIVDEKTCEEMKQDKAKHKTTTSLICEVTAALKEVLTQLHSSTSWDEEELKSTIEIVIKYPLKAYELCSAGEKVETTYTTNAADNQMEKSHSRMGYSVCHKVTIDNEEHTSHYEITAYHPLMPTKSTQFNLTYHPLPSTTDTTIPPDAAKFRCIKQCPDAVQTKYDRDSTFMSTMLRASVFPQQTKESIQMLKEKFAYTTNVCSSASQQATHYKAPTQAELVVGKSGLVDLKNYEECSSYEYNILENHKHEDHPCNIDVAVMKLTGIPETKRISGQHPCSIEESFSHVPQNITWSGPPGQSYEERKGNVVYIKDDGTVCTLSTKGLTKFNDPPCEDDEYPGYAWDPIQHELPGYSGAPVFLESRDGTSLLLLGNLITAASASPVRFSLDMVRDEMAIHHIDHILTEQQQLEYMYTTSIARIKPDVIERLKQYKEYLMWHSKEQSLTPLMEERYIRCELSICIHPHQNN